MNSFIRQTLARTLALGAIGAGFLGAIATKDAIALPQAQVAEKLSSVPVFVLGNDNGLILVSKAPEGEAAAEEPAAEPSLFVFMTEQDAETFLARANEANPEFAPDAQVGITNLESLYTESQSSDEEPLNLIYVPEEAEATQAAELNEQYRGDTVPLFFAQFEDGSLAPVEQNDGEMILPMFFSRADLDGVLNELEARNPEARAAISIGVVPLEAMLAEMETSDNESLNQIRLFPDSETINALRSGIEQNAAPAEAPESAPEGE
ncbi:MAG: Tic22 family protein [Cyanobacteria bacterium P01_A01_bin.116]